MRSFVLLAFTLSLLAGCSSGPRLNTDYTSANQDSRVQFIVLHYTSTDLPHSLGILTHGGVSAHYLIGDDEPATVPGSASPTPAWCPGRSPANWRAGSPN